MYHLFLLILSLTSAELLQNTTIYLRYFNNTKLETNINCSLISDCLDDSICQKCEINSPTIFHAKAPYGVFVFLEIYMKNPSIIPLNDLFRYGYTFFSHTFSTIRIDKFGKEYLASISSYQNFVDGTVNKSGNFLSLTVVPGFVFNI